MTDPLAAARLNSHRRPLRFAEGQAQGQAYMLECRDLGDHDATDAGVYFMFCANESALREAIQSMPDDDPWNRILGIFDLRRPLAEQGLGLTRASYGSRRSSTPPGPDPSR